MKKPTKKAVRRAALRRRNANHRRTRVTHGQAGQTRYVRVSLRPTKRGSV